ncbi:hypothetical protein, partial [Faecalibaculum rodentium]
GEVPVALLVVAWASVALLGGLSVACLVVLNPVLDYVYPWFSLVRYGALCLDVIISGSQCAVFCPVWNHAFC